ncbi:cytochrome c [Thalassospira sp. MA62]|nr:cytochrome c [Thalassospira sp. MA62]
MNKFTKLIAALVVIGLVGLALFILLPVARTPAQSDVPADFAAAEGHGEYVMRLSDCKACHTAEGGKPFAGGRAIASPFGTIWSTNITPDPENGIGSYSLDDFRAALYDGIEPDNTHLYPAMPYENYRKLREEDVRALYDYFMNEVEPVAEAAPETDLAFPFNQRWGIRLWNWFAMKEAGHEDRYGDEVLDRGAYLVDSAGHCAACHSPRNPIFAQAGDTPEDEEYLAGGVIGTWPAPSLHGEESAPAKWSADDLAAYLTAGRNSHSAVAGEMTQVVGESLQYATDEDMHAMVAYLRHINGLETDADAITDYGSAEGIAADNAAVDKGDDLSSDTAQLLASADPSMPLGARLYLDNCNACHFVDGQGARGVFPALDGNSLVTSETPGGLIDVILHGARMPSTDKRPETLAMPGFGDRLSDEELAALASFVRQAWSNDASAITTEEAAEMRDQGFAH